MSSSTPNTRVLKAILDGIGASTFLQQFEDNWLDDNSLESLSLRSSAQIASKFGFSDDLASAFIAGCRNRERYITPHDHVEVIACTCNRPLCLTRKFPSKEFDQLFKERTDILKEAAQNSKNGAKPQQIEDRIHQTWVAGITQALTDTFGGIPATLWPNPETFLESFRDSKDIVVHFKEATHAASFMQGRGPIGDYIVAKHPVQGRQLSKPKWNCTCGQAQDGKANGRMFSEILCEFKSEIVLQLKVSRNLRVGMQLFLTSDTTRLSFGTLLCVVEQATPHPENMKFLGEITSIGGKESHNMSAKNQSEEVVVSLCSPLYPEKKKIPYTFVHDGQSFHADLVEASHDEIKKLLKFKFLELHLQEMHAFRDFGEGEFDVSLFDQREQPDRGRCLFISSTVRDRVKEKWAQFIHFMSFEGICDFCMRCSSSDMGSRSKLCNVREIDNLFRYMNPLPPEALISGKLEHEASKCKENIRKWCEAGATSWPSEIVDIFMFVLQPNEDRLSLHAKKAFFYVLSWKHRHSLSSEGFKQSNMSQLLQRLPQVEDFLPDFAYCIRILHRQLIFEWLMQLPEEDAVSIVRSFSKKQSSADKKAVRCRLMGGKEEKIGLGRFVADSAPWTLAVELQHEKAMESFLECDGEYQCFWNHSFSPQHSTPICSSESEVPHDTNGVAADGAFIEAAKIGESVSSSESFVCLYFSSYEILRLRARLNDSFTQRIRVSHPNSVFIRVPDAPFAPGTSVMVSFDRISGSARSIHSNGLCFLNVCRIHNADSSIPYDSSNTHEYGPRLIFGDGVVNGINESEFESKIFLDQIQLAATVLYVDLSAGIYKFRFFLVCLFSNF
jgi:hypothetical protein